MNIELTDLIRYYLNYIDVFKGREEGTQEWISCMRCIDKDVCFKKSPLCIQRLKEEVECSDLLMPFLTLEEGFNKILLEDIQLLGMLLQERIRREN